MAEVGKFQKTRHNLKLLFPVCLISLVCASDLYLSSFSSLDLLPDDILWRPKEGFSDGISSVKRSWFELIQDHVDKQISDSTLEEAALLYPHNTPKTKEALYYRQIFEKYYPNKSKWIAYFWMPKWTDADDPSARTLKHYKQ